MDLDELCKILQNWTNRIPLIVLGSGSSVPFNLPSMNTLGEHLRDNIAFTYQRDIDQFEKFKIYLTKYKDLEKALFKISNIRIGVLNEIIIKTWHFINKYDLIAYDKIIRKELDFPLNDLLSYFLEAADRKATIITTNYDRIAEYAASMSNALINTGYLQNYIGAFESDINKITINKQFGYKGQVNIWKVHGSLDWFKSENQKLYHLPFRRDIPDDYMPSIVTPGTGKYFETHKDPFRTIFSEADNAIKNANGYLCIGYGFNDEHVQPYLLDQIQRDKPIIVVTKELTNATKESIINNRCKNYVLIEEGITPASTKIYSSSHGEITFDDCSFWQLREYIKLIKS